MLGQEFLTLWLTVALAPVPMPNKSVKIPETGPPRFVVVQRIDAKRNVIYLAHHVTVPVSVPERRVEVRNGQKVTVTVNVIRYRHSVRVLETFLPDVEFSDRTGKVMPAKTALKNLPGKMVLLANDKKGVDAAYRKLLAKDALVLIRRK